MIENDAAQRWLDAYVDAWKSYDREAIGELFAAEVEYRYHPYDRAIRGRDAVVDSWLGEGGHESAPSRDDPGTYEAAYCPIAIDGDIVVATGSSRYWDRPGGNLDAEYFNCFVLRFDGDGRCRSFTEYYVRRPEAVDP